MGDIYLLTNVLSQLSATACITACCAQYVPQQLCVAVDIWSPFPNHLLLWQVFSMQQKTGL